MYAVKEIHDFSRPFTLPDCMYKVKNIHEVTEKNEKRTKVDANANAEADTLEDRQDKILRQLELLKQQLSRLKSNDVSEAGDERISRREKSTDAVTRDIVVNANPNHAPYSLLLMLKLMKNRARVGNACFVHSSLANPPENAKTFLQPSRRRHEANCFITLIWKRDTEVDPVMMVNPVTQVAIQGEVNILRYLSRLVTITSSPLEIHHLTQVDAVLDVVHGSLIHGNNKERQSTIRLLEARLSKDAWIAGKTPTIADLAAWSALKQCRLIDGLSSNLKKWVASVNALN